jgi:hypothetical protein
VKDGYYAAASALSEATLIVPPTIVKEEEDRLLKLIQLGLQKERESKRSATSSNVTASEGTIENLSQILSLVKIVLEILSQHCSNRLIIDCCSVVIESPIQSWKKMYVLRCIQLQHY